MMIAGELSSCFLLVPFMAMIPIDGSRSTL